MAFETRNIRQSQRKKEVKKAAVAVGHKVLGATKKIGASFSPRAGNTEKQTHRKWKNWFIASFAVILGVLVVFGTSAHLLRGLADFGLRNVLRIIGTDLPVDENGFTNILLLGVGGQGHDGEDLTDTIILASIDEKNDNVVMLSIPRDFYVEGKETNSRINEIIRDSIYQYPRDERMKGFREGMALLQEEIRQMTGLTVHRFVQIDFQGFAKGIDALGGVNVDVEKTIDDPAYPTVDWGYERFYLPAGLRHLDGETALKFVRSRHSSSDFERSQRQRLLLEAVKEKAISLDLLTSPQKLRELYGIVAAHLQTDLTWEEMVSLASVGYGLPRANLLSYGLNNDETAPGGFLVTPARELYGGASVLVPFLNLDKENKYLQLQLFAENIFLHRDLQFRKIPLIVRNGTKVSGAAGNAALALERYGIPVTAVENSAEPAESTQIVFPDRPKEREIALLLQRYFQAKLHPFKSSAEETNPGVIILIGSDFSFYRRPYPADASFLLTPP